MHSCGSPDNWTDKKRYPLFMARNVLRGLLQGRPSTGDAARENFLAAYGDFDEVRCISRSLFKTEGFGF